ncbi:MAG: DUF4878 domain-containing protein [Capnocytophaga sp.]|nr:DUF4878 domain-containing protein [Capnocytophaga sp.]
MKNFSFLLILVAMFFVACNNSNTPEVVTKKFVEAMEAGNFKEAKLYCDDSTAKLLGILESVPSDKEKENAKSKGNVKINITKTDIKDNEAEVFYTIGEEKEEKSMKLKKIEGKWKISIGKENGENKESGHGHDHFHDGHSHDDGHNHFHDSIPEVEDLSIPNEGDEIDLPIEK